MPASMRRSPRGANGRVHLLTALACFCYPAATALADRARDTSNPTSIFAPVSTPAQSIFGLSLFVLATTAAIFLVVFGLLAYAVVKFRERKTDDEREPPQVYGLSLIHI